MSLTVREFIASEQWKATLARVRASITQTVMAESTSEADRAKALTKFHLLAEVEVELSNHIME